MTKGISITITDLETNETETTEIWDDFLLICAGNRELTSTQAYGNGTQVLTVKKVAS